MRPYAAVVGALLVIAAGPRTARPQAVLLRLTPPAGQVSRYRTVNQSWVTFPGQAPDTTRPAVEQTTWTTRTVTGVSGEIRVVRTVVDSSQSMMAAMGGAAPGGDMLRGMRLLQRIDSRGHILSTDVTPPAGLDSSMARRIAQNAGNASTVLPERPLSRGQSWSDSMMMAPAQGAGRPGTSFQMSYMLDRVEQRGGARIAVIGLKGVLLGDSAETGGQPAGTMTGELQLDLTAGRILRSTTELHVQIETPNGRVPMKVTSVMELLPS